MAQRRSTTQPRRRTHAAESRTPPWAWVLLGCFLMVLAYLLLPTLLRNINSTEGASESLIDRFANRSSGDGFYRAPAQDAPRAAPVQAPVAAQPAPVDENFEFYNLLPNQQPSITDAQAAAAQREESARAERALQQQQQAAALALQEARRPAAIDREQPATAADAIATPAPTVATPVAASNTPAAAPAPTSTAAPAPATAAAPAVTTTTSPASRQQAAPTTAPAQPAVATAAASPRPSTAAASAPAEERYILQAGSFQGNSEAEAMKARLALLGVNAQVESAQVNGNTVYRVRTAPYSNANELSDARNRLTNSGINPMAIKVN